MTFFTLDEFTNKYSDYASLQIPTYYIEASCEMIFSQIGTRFRDASWDSDSVPLPIKNASMEQLRFMYEYDIPFIDYKGKVEAGEMKSEFKTKYSTLALQMLANAGYLYRGVPLNQNMGINLTWSE